MLALAPPCSTVCGKNNNLRYRALSWPGPRVPLDGRSLACGVAPWKRALAHILNARITMVLPTRKSFRTKTVEKCTIRPFVKLVRRAQARGLDHLPVHHESTVMSKSSLVMRFIASHESELTVQVSDWAHTPNQIARSSLATARMALWDTGTPFAGYWFDSRKDTCSRVRIA